MIKLIFSGFITIAFFSSGITPIDAQLRIRDYGIKIGVFSPGKWNAITDVNGVKVGHSTLNRGQDVRTGVTSIVPHGGNIFRNKVPAAIYIGNGFGKLAGISQIRELGNIETPIILTNTLSVATGINGVISWTLNNEENGDVRSVNAVVGETNDGRLNDIRGRHVKESDVITAIESAVSGPIQEGNVGAGTGTVCFGWKGGIGTSSRKLPNTLGGYMIGVLVQSNFGGLLEIAGVPVGKELGKYPYKKEIESDSDGSCMIIIATDAPIGSRNLERLAKRAMLGLSKTGGIASNGSGDYVIAFSTFTENRINYQNKESIQTYTELNNDRMSPLFMATIEATQEAIFNSLFVAETMIGREGVKVEALPLEDVFEIMIRYGYQNLKFKN